MTRNQRNIHAAANYLVNLAQYYQWLKELKLKGLSFGNNPQRIYDQSFDFVLDLVGIQAHPEIDIRHGLKRIFEDNPPKTEEDGRKLLTLMYKTASLEEQQLQQALNSDRTAEVYFDAERFFGEGYE